jgi:hypothetical protein
MQGARVKLGNRGGILLAVEQLLMRPPHAAQSVMNSRRLIVALRVKAEHHTNWQAPEGQPMSLWVKAYLQCKKVCPLIADIERVGRNVR